MAQEVTIPAALSTKYRLTKPIFGGPVFDFPAFSITRINLATLTEQQAERLVRAGWAGIEKVTPAAYKSPEKTVNTDLPAKP